MPTGHRKSSDYHFPFRLRHATILRSRRRASPSVDWVDKAIMPHPVWGMAIVLGALGGLMAILRGLQALCSPHPELVRKLMHMGMGVVMAALPWLFDAVWPVWVLAAAAIGMLLAVRFVPALRQRFGSV